MRRAVGLMRFAREAVGASEASLFLLDPKGGTLRGVVSEWDWTRTSFPAAVHAWPTVSSCLSDGEVRVISASEAVGSEHEWFEPRGVAMTVCVPLWDKTRALGVFFFDFRTGDEPFAEEDRPFLADVGWRCARALAREGKGDPALLDRAIQRVPAPLSPGSQRSLQSLLDAAVTDVATAEHLLEEAVDAMRGGTREKVVVDATVERAFARVRAAREELVRLNALLDHD
ncbi:MAG: GAF domain-containing protein [Deltaproteobacteria bacterium]|nr:GAF domain-containing protein [Deltaproteobacteria bacterium]